MSNNITLTASMRNNLSALKTLTTEMGGTQTKLATGKKVNSAIDNASSYYQARSLNNRAADLDALLDAMGQGIQTINAASEGIEAGLQMIEQMQSVAAGAAAIAGDSSLQIDAVFNGRANTQAIVDQIGENGIAAYATTQFYVPDVGADDENFGQGKWYLPALGELMDVFGEYDIKFYKRDAHYYKYDENQQQIEISREEYEQLKGNYYLKEERNNATGEVTRSIINGEEYQQFLDEHRFGWYYSEIDLKVSVSSGIGYSAGEVDISKEEFAQLQKDGYYELSIRNKKTNETTLSYVNREELQQIDPHLDKWSTYYQTETEDVYINGGIGLTVEGIDKTNYQTINNTLSLLADAGVEASTLTITAGPPYYSSSTEAFNNTFWYASDAYVYMTGKIAPYQIRPFTLLENKFNGNAAKPELGDVMYSDLSYGKAADYDGSKTAVGVVTWVSEDGGSARVMNLKNLTSWDNPTVVGTFHPDDPYGGNSGGNGMSWATDGYSEDISGVENIEFDNVYYSFEGSNVYIDGMNLYKYPLYKYATSSAGSVPSTADLSGYQQQFNAIYQQYDNLIKDASYQGINLLNGNDLQVMFNESRNHSYTVRGQHADAASLGLIMADWHSGADVAAAISQLQKATDTLRAISTELGNSYAILTTRQEFTDAIIDILQTGADDLVLADMNEESANYLALQTRQQLAVNSLSLASQAASAVLKLF